jgi:hypothetical protein
MCLGAGLRVYKWSNPRRPPVKFRFAVEDIMHSRSSLWSVFLAFSLLLLIPVSTFAQSAISGLVADSTGAVLPGVTVEAASPALIEKVRSVVSDAQGRYTIVDLRPGTYKVTFTLPGFNTMVRDGVELPANFTATVNGELRVGSLEETITVSGQAPLVDVSSAQRTQVISRETIDALPVSRNYKSVGALMIGVRSASQQVGDLAAGSQARPSVHGAPADTTMLFDGLMALTLMGDGQINQYHNDGIAQEVVYQTSAVNAEVSRGGLLVNIIPKDGGNVFRGGGFFSHSSGKYQANNETQELKDKGLISANKLELARDWNPYFGGPLMKDKLWFIISARKFPVHFQVANTQYPDGSPGVQDNDTDSLTARLTLQANQKHKAVIFYDRMFKDIDHFLSANEDPVTGTKTREPLVYSVQQIKWTATLSNRMLYEMGYSGVIQTYTSLNMPGIKKVRGTPEWYATAGHSDITTGRRWHAGIGTRGDYPSRHTWSTALSYVTGSHNVKAGVQWGFGTYRKTNDINADLVQIYNDSRPQFVDVIQSPLSSHEKLNAELGLFAQDSWSVKRLTVNGGLRFEYFNSSIEEQYAPAGRFLPARFFPRVPNLPNWKDVSPRFGGAYDLFGDGRTALKASVGKYMGNQGLNFAQRYNPMTINSDRRDWTDRDRLGRDLPTNLDDIAQDNEIGPSNNQNFGIAVTRQMDPDLKRTYNIEYSASIQHQLFSGLSLTGAWYRRTYYNIEKSVNLLVSDSDYTAFQTASPLNNGEMITVYNLNLAKQGQVLIQDTFSETNRRTYDGFELGVNWRLPRGAALFGGVGPERVVSTLCDVDNPNQRRFCDQSGKLFQELGKVPGIPFQWDFKVAGNTPLPMGFQLGVSTQNLYGNTRGNSGFEYWLHNNWNVPAARFPNGQRTQSVTVNLVPPSTKRLDRVKQLDFSLRRSFRVRNVNINPRFDVYNVFNSNVVLSQNQNFGSTLDRPDEILQGRLPRIAVQIDF